MPSAALLASTFLLPILVSTVLPHIVSFFKVTSMSPAEQLHVAPYEIAQPAFLYVTAETGELATDDEFNCSSMPASAKLHH